MRLRARLAVIVLVTALPVVAGITWARARFERHTIEQAMRDLVLGRMENGGREMCEAYPETFPEPPWRRAGLGRDRDERREPWERWIGGPGEGEGGPPRSRAANGERRNAERPMDNAGTQPRDTSNPQRESATPRAPLEPGQGPDPAQGTRTGDRGPEGRGGPPPDRLGNRERRGPPPGEEFGEGGRGARGFERRGLAAGLPRVDLWAYDAQFVSKNPRAPAFPAALKAALEAGEDLASGPWRTELRGEPVEGFEFAVRMPWEEGPCAIMLAQRPDTGPRSAVIDLLWSSLALCGVLLGAVLFAAGPIVERVRVLTAQVRDSAAGGYTTQVEARGRDEISELAQAFNSAGSEVRANLEAIATRERTLRTFVENTSHDVMLPLTVLQGHLTNLRRRVEAGQLPDRELVRDALEESHYLSSLLQNLSIAAKLEGGEPLMARHPVDLNALVERAVSRQRPIAKQKNVQVEFAVPEDVIHVVGDITFVEQMLSNVIHNAVRYNREGGHVAVLLEERGAAHDEFALRVLDDGPGIPSELREKVVERSFRTDDARTRAPDGLGLGLSIAHDVARRHGFAMAMKESPAGGLEVEFTGPRARLPLEGGGAAKALGAGDAAS